MGFTFKKIVIIHFKIEKNTMYFMKDYWCTKVILIYLIEIERQRTNIIRQV